MKTITLLILFLFDYCIAFAQNVGIGTTTPAFRLDVKNGSINTDSVYRIGGSTVLSVKGFTNTFVGLGPGDAPALGFDNTAIGARSLAANTTGDGNTAEGAGTLENNTTGAQNTAIGLNSLFQNLNGSSNTSAGAGALRNNNSGSFNTAVGVTALYGNQNDFNTGVGSTSLFNTTNSQYNVAVGFAAGNSYNNGYNNVFVGANTNTNGSGYFNVIAVGQGTVVTASSRAYFGNPATNVYAGWAGWSTFSDGRFKRNVTNNVPGLDFINSLRPVTYNLEATAIDAFLHKNTQNKISVEGSAVHAKALREKEAIVYTGFIAQEVEATAKQLGFVFSGVTAAKNEQDTYSLCYAEFVVPLVKAVQEQQDLIENQNAKIEKLEKQNIKIEQLEKQNQQLIKRLQSLENKNN